MSKTNNQSISRNIHRALLIPAFLIILISSSVFLYFENWRYNNSIEYAKQLLITLGRQNNDELANYLAFLQDEALSLTLKRLADEEHLAFAAICNTHRKILHQEDSSEYRPRIISQDLFQDKTTFLQEKKHKILFYSQPIKIADHIYGYLILGYNLHELAQTRKISIMVFVLTMLCLVLIVNSTLRYLLNKNILSPIAKLHKAMEQLDRGELGTQLLVNSKDELGDIARIFNKMSSGLRENILNLQQTQKELFEQIKEKKTALAFLEKSEANYRNMLHNIPGAIFRRQPPPSWKMNYASEFLQNILEPETCRKLLTGETDFLALVHHKDRQRLVEAICRACKENRQINIEYRLVTGKTEEVWVMERSRAIYDKQEQLIDGILFDITHLKQTEQDKNRLEATLRHAQKMEAIGTLAGGIAHDFNNILQGIAGYLELIDKDINQASKTFHYLEQCKSVVQRATELITRLLTFSRKSDIKLRPVDLNQEIRLAVNLIQRTIPKMIRTELHLEEPLNTIMADSSQMEQIIINLLTNSKDAMPDGGTIEITTQNILKEEIYPPQPGLTENNYVLLQIKDNGCGMDKNTLANIFDPFFTTKETGKGTGLGLAAVYGIVQEHKGQIFCQSSPGKGTTFKIFLPAGSIAPQKEKTSSRPVSNEYVRTNSRPNRSTILIIDDETAVQEVTADILQNCGYQTICADTGEKGLELIRNNPAIDLVLMDLNMPGMGGKKALEKITKTAPHLKVIVISGYSEHKISQDPKRFGAAGFLKKPFRLQELIETVQSHLQADRNETDQTAHNTHIKPK